MFKRLSPQRWQGFSSNLLPSVSLDPIPPFPVTILSCCFKYDVICKCALFSCVHVFAVRAPKLWSALPEEKWRTESLLRFETLKLLLTTYLETFIFVFLFRFYLFCLPVLLFVVSIQSLEKSFAVYVSANPGCVMMSPVSSFGLNASFLLLKDCRRCCNVSLKTSRFVATNMDGTLCLSFPLTNVKTASRTALPHMAALTPPTRMSSH